MVFCGTFTAGGLKTRVEDGKLTIEQEGTFPKFVKQVEHVTFSGDYANEVKQEVFYITERAVFELRPEGLLLTETAPGIDLEKDILAHMDFTPLMAEPLRTMDIRLFSEAVMGIAGPQDEPVVQ